MTNSPLFKKEISDLVSNTDNKKQFKFRNKVNVPKLTDIQHNKLLFPSWLKIKSINGEKLIFHKFTINDIPKNIIRFKDTYFVLSSKWTEFIYFSVCIGRLYHLYNLAIDRINLEQGRRTYKNISNKNIFFKINKPFCDELMKDLIQQHYKIKISSQLGEELSELLYNEVSERIQYFFDPPKAISQNSINLLVYSAFIAHIKLNTDVHSYPDGDITSAFNDIIYNSSFQRYRPLSLHRSVKRLPTQTSSCLPNMVKKVDDREHALNTAKSFIAEINKSSSILDVLFEKSIPCVCFSRNPVSLGESGIISEQVYNLKKLKFEPSVSARMIFGGPHREILIETTLVRNLIDFWSINRLRDLSITAIGRRSGLISSFLKEKHTVNTVNKTNFRHSIDYRGWDSRLHPAFLLSYYASVSTSLRTNEYYSFKVLKYIAIYMVFTPIILNDDKIIYQLRGNYSGGESTASINCFINVALVNYMTLYHLGIIPNIKTYEVMGDDNLLFTKLTIKQIIQAVSEFDFEVSVKKTTTAINQEDPFPYLGFTWIPAFDYAPTQSFGWLIGRSIYPERFITEFGEYPVWIDRFLSLGMHLYNGFNYTLPVLIRHPLFREILASPEYQVHYLGPDLSVFSKTYPIRLYENPRCYLNT